LWFLFQKGADGAAEAVYRDHVVWLGDYSVEALFPNPLPW
jgi:hypothetical protein